MSRCPPAVSCPPAARSAAGPAPAPPPGTPPPAGRSTLRTDDSDTPAAAAIPALPRPCPSSSRIRATTAGVSFEARRGPLRSGTSPATPPAASAFSHRHTLTGITPNASATCAWVAAFSLCSCTAASRRPASSPASHANVASPCTHITPLPSGPVTMPTPGAISAASPGSSGNGTWVSIRAIIPSPPAASNLSSIIADQCRRTHTDTTGTKKITRSAAQQHPVTEPLCQEPWAQDIRNGTHRPGPGGDGHSADPAATTHRNHSSAATSS